MKRISCAVAISLLVTTACRTKQPDPDPITDQPTDDGGSVPYDPNQDLPFNPADPDATFSATLLVEDRDGLHPSASLKYGGSTFSTDANGKLTISNMRVRDLSGLRLTAEGYLPRAVRLSFQDAGADRVLRVVLEKPGAQQQFDASVGGDLAHGPMSITLTGGSFRTAGGQTYSGQVTVSALGFDPVASALNVSADGISLRGDFDLGRIPQGFGVAADAQNNVHFLLPESVFQVELSGADGEHLSLDGSTPATFRFRLSNITTRSAGDVIPTYTFDETRQMWVQDGQCTVQEVGSGGELECIGTTTHFSSWMVASGKDTTTGSCGNFRFVAGTAGGKYPGNVTADDGTTARNTFEIVKAYGRASATDSPTVVATESPAFSLNRSCFVQGDPNAYVSVKATLPRLENGSIVKDVRYFRFGKNTCPSSYFGSNVQLVRSSDFKLTAGQTFDAIVESACAVCPEILVHLNPNDGALENDPCACDPCGDQASCTPVSATDYRCDCKTKGLSFNSTNKTCAAPNCGSGLDFNLAAGACIDHKDCPSSPPLAADPSNPCQANAGCVDSPKGSYTCTCLPGFAPSGAAGAHSPSGSACVAMTKCETGTCMGHGTCMNTSTSRGYSCECDPPYTGVNCEQDVDECSAPSPVVCPTGNTCVNNIPGYNCVCSPTSGSDTTCDGVDDDCANGIDDGFEGRQCVSPSGCFSAACISATESCGVVGATFASATEAGSCEDGIDNDCNGSLDCEDGNCMGVGNCPFCPGGPTGSTGAEICSGGVDEDCNGSVDCEDTACLGVGSCPACPGGPVGGTGPEVCTGGIDENCDGFVDCSDSTCLGDPACTPACANGPIGVTGPEDCAQDGVDNDCNGQIDCADVACESTPLCLAWCGPPIGSCAAPNCAGNSSCVCDATACLLGGYCNPAGDPSPMCP